MTKYQVVAVRTHERISIGDPHEFMSAADFHAEELRRVLHLARDTKVEVLVELVDVP